jgi:hypothetical protein
MFILFISLIFLKLYSFYLADRCSLYSALFLYRFQISFQYEWYIKNDECLLIFISSFFLCSIFRIFFLNIFFPYQKQNREKRVKKSESRLLLSNIQQQRSIKWDFISLKILIACSVRGKMKAYRCRIGYLSYENIVKSGIPTYFLFNKFNISTAFDWTFDNNPRSPSPLIISHYEKC